MLLVWVMVAGGGAGCTSECGRGLSTAPLCWARYMDMRQLLRHIYVFAWQSGISHLCAWPELVSHCAARTPKRSPPNFLLPTSAPLPPSAPQIDSGYRIAHIADGGRASHGQLSSDLPSFDEIRAANLKYDLADAALYKVGSVEGSVRGRCGTVECRLMRSGLPTSSMTWLTPSCTRWKVWG